MTVKLRIILGELLYICRPIVQAETDVFCATTTSSPNRLKSWLLCLTLDVLSLLSLDACRRNGNAVTVAEWKRRRLRLLLYLLRSPVWDRYTATTANRVSSAVGKIPLVGGLLNNYIWDWIFYWKLYRAEEG